jgi:hypothetical protein
MKKILLANVGNRNIQVQDFKINEEFRSQTQQILENYEAYENKISLHIIPQVIDEVKDTLDQIVLFYTDSPKGTRDNQDTIYAAEIIKRKLEKSYQIPVITEPLNCNVTDVNGLMARYRRKIKNLLNQFPNHTFVLCEAGGTSQQKFALKIVSEFAIDENKLECYNVELTDQDNRISRLVKYNAIEYKKIILAEQISRLLDSLNYDSILLLTGKNAKNILSKETKFLIDTGFLSVNMNVKKLRQLLNQASKKILEIEPIKSLSNETWYSYPQWLKENIEYSDYLHICLASDAAHCFYETGKLGLSVLYYHIAVENIISSIIESLTGMDINNTKNWEELKNQISHGKYKFYPRFDQISYNIITPSIPFKIEFIRSNLYLHEVNEFLDEYEKVNSTYLSYKSKVIEEDRIGLNILRNKFAHEGKIVTDEDFKKILPFISYLKNFIGISDENNFFIKLNECIRESLL